jgi:hypothetical protein
MIPLNILYTPLDTPPTPIIDTEKFINWCKNNGPKQSILDRRDASLAKDTEVYPWNIAYAKNVNVWQGNFQKEFPEVAQFFYEAFSIPDKDVRDIILLPIKQSYSGIGFWHSDPDEHGLRIYLQNEDTEDSLLIRPTILPYNSRPNIIVNDREPSLHVQDKEYSAKIIHPRQSFFLNNVRAVHTVKVNKPDSIRIAALVCGLGPLVSMRQGLCDLINRSAKKYSDAAIYWTPP